MLGLRVLSAAAQVRGLCTVAPLLSPTANAAAKVAGIVGGVGPDAAISMHRLILKHTQTDGTDQSHLEVHHISRGNIMIDRTKYLLNPDKFLNPGVSAAHCALALRASAQACGHGQVVLGVPCNTFHSPPIWKAFLEEMARLGIKGEEVKALHMIEEMHKLVFDLLPSVECFGIMSTTGTRKVGVHSAPLEAKGKRVVQVPESMQDEVHDTIYNQEWGIKAVSGPVHPKALENCHRFAKMMIAEGAQAIVLGCSEFPLALPSTLNYDGTGVALVDPVEALSRAVIGEVAPEKLKPLN